MHANTYGAFLAICFVIYCACLAYGYFKKKMPVGVILAVCLCAVGTAFGIVLVRRALDDYAESKSSSQKIPLTRIYKQDESWKLVAAFELVAGTSSLYVGVAHRPGDHASDNRLVYLDVRGCHGNVPRIPNVGEDVPVVLVEARAAPSLGLVTKHFFPTLAFAKHNCWSSL